MGLSVQYEKVALFEALAVDRYDGESFQQWVCVDLFNLTRLSLLWCWTL